MEQKPFLSKFMKDEKTRNAILQWWRGLETNRGGRAQLRRCRAPSQVFLHSAFYELNHALPQWPKGQGMSLAAIAGLIANVDARVRGLCFPQQLGTPKDQGGSPPMSENRFKQLIKSRDWPEFYIRMRRAILMLKRNANIISLADYIRLFGVEHYTKDPIEPSKRFQFRMAEEYFKTTLQNVKPSN